MSAGAGEPAPTSRAGEQERGVGEPIERYRALALQTACHAVNRYRDVAAARQAIRANLARVAEQVRASRAFIGPDLRLVVLPEYVLTGFPMGESLELWREKACLRPGGPEEEALGALAAEQDLWLCGNAYELDDDFPGLYFQTCVVIGPDGAVLTRYRRLNSMFAPTPHDVWERYLELHGLDGVFPVARTPIGNLATVASEEILYPEVARAFVLRGAEVLLHPTSESGSPADTPKSITRRARAIENLAYVVSANTAGVRDVPLPAASADGNSCIIDPHGRVVAQAGTGETMVANGVIDLAALRAERRRPGMANLLSRQRLEPFAATYADSIYPAGSLDAGPPDGRAHFVEVQRQVIDRLAREGRI